MGNSTVKIEHRPKVSIIIPVYNVEPFIGQCAKSLLEQTYENIEFIFINDASTDDSLAVLESTISLYPHRCVKVISNSDNCGSSASRNIGIRCATGDFLNFCDSDDWIEPTMIAEMVECAMKKDADIVATPFYTNTFNKQNILQFKSKKIADLNTIPIDFSHFSLCNKLTKTSLIKDAALYSLPNVNCWEDLSIISRIYALSPKVELLDKPFYHYRKYEYHSLTSSSHEHQLKDRLIYCDFLIKWFNDNYLTNQFTPFLNHLKFTAKIKMLRTSPRQFKRWKATYPESNKHIMSYNDVPLHYRILFYWADKLIT